MAQSLTQQLAELRAQSRARRSAVELEVMDEATAGLVAADVVGSSVQPGAKAPQFTLPDATGGHVSLSGLLAKGPVVLSFYRGGWCPYCSLELRALQGVLPEITGAGATLVAVSPQAPDSSLSTVEKLELAFPVLSDAGNAVAESYGLVFTLPEPLREVYDGFGIDLLAANGDGTFRLPVPATFVIAPDGTVVWRFADPDYTRRADPSDVLAALASLAASSSHEVA